MNRLAVKLHPASERQVKRSHPWIFDGGVRSCKPDTGKAGDLAIIFDRQKDKFLAAGLWDPDSPIRIKILQHGSAATIDADWFHARIAAARELRKPLLETDTTAYRLIFGEGDGLPGLICDIYEKTAVVKLYSSAWFPWLDMLVPAIVKYSDCDSVLLRLARKVRHPDFSEGDLLYGSLESDLVNFREHGVLFSADLRKGHKTGYFLDHRHNRHRLGQQAAGKTVLDVFCYTGGFSTHALAGGAESVTSIDISAAALEQARSNAKLNPHKGRHDAICGDAFGEMEKQIAAGNTYDIVVIDPPSFAKAAAEVETAIKQYKRLASLGKQLTSKGGQLVLASCSSRVQREAFFRANDEILKPHFKLEHMAFHDTDHPLIDAFPEGAYLKCGCYRKA